MFAMPKGAIAQQADDAGSQSDDENAVEAAETTPKSTSIPYQYQAFAEPKAIPSIGGVASWNNGELKETSFTYQVPGQGSPQTVEVRSYGGAVPGPSFVLDPGERIEISLQNLLSSDSKFVNPCNAPDGNTMNYPSHLNNTNLHFHGLHVSPGSYYLPQQTNGTTLISRDGKPHVGEENKVLSSDDVLFDLEPGKSHDWCVWLPTFHAPGTHWYHSHRHGATGLQVSNGMAGAIIIREPSLALNIVSPTEDKVWVLQEIIPNPSCNSKDDTINCDLSVYQKGGGDRGDFLVNGIYQPTLAMEAGTTQRWRLINATSTPRGWMNLKLYKCQIQGNAIEIDLSNLENSQLAPLWLMAVDGISFYGKPPTLIGNGQQVDASGMPPKPAEQPTLGWELAPGNRADFLVNLDAGDYVLVKTFSAGQGGNLQNQNQILAVIRVSEAPEGKTPDTIPATIPGSLKPYPYLRPIFDEELVNQPNQPGEFDPKHLVFNVNQKSGFGPKRYQIAGYVIPESGDSQTKSDFIYQENCAGISVNLESCMEWGLATMAGAFHPFHIHVNPFQVKGEKIDPDGPDDPTNWRWRDVIAVPKTAPPEDKPLPDPAVYIRNRFADYAGQYVYHCHILIHEDQGMMINVTVNSTAIDSGTEPCRSLDLYGNSEPSPQLAELLAEGAEVYPSAEDLCGLGNVPPNLTNVTCSPTSQA